MGCRILSTTLATVLFNFSLIVAQASPAYMALAYVNDPVSHAFNFTKKAQLGIAREPEFKKDFIETQQKCRDFAVNILNSCRNSTEVEIVLDDPTPIQSQDSKPKYSRLYK